jgi:putative SOS response-associated peptidase YedK
MCGRFLLTSSADEIVESFNVVLPDALRVRYNIAPTDPVLVIDSIADDGRRARMARWGFVQEGRGPVINVRGEAVKNGAFRSAYAKRRVLVPANGFYEWRREGKNKLPYLFKPDHTPFAFAGLAEGDAVTILTRAAVAPVAGIHDRMPMILRDADWDTWLDPDADPRAKGVFEFVPELTAIPVSQKVNSVRNDDASVLEPPQAATSTPQSTN